MPGHNFQVSTDVVSENEVKEYTCRICHLLLRETVNLPCHHPTCKDCLKNWEEHLDESQFKCPDCNITYDQTKVHSMPIIDRLVLTTLPVKCKQSSESCTWVGSIYDYEIHERACEFLSIPCKYEGCNQKVMRKDTEMHYGVCEYRIIECKYCHADTRFNSMKDHLEDCDDAPILCKNEGCFEEIVRKMIEHHEKECLYEEVPCVYQCFGCMEIMKRSEVDAHIERNLAEHSHMFLEKAQSLERQKEEIKKEYIKELEELQNQSKKEKQSSLKIIHELQNEIIGQESEKEEIKTENVELKKRVTELENQCQILVQAHEEEIQQFRQAMEEHDEEDGISLHSSTGRTADAESLNSADSHILTEKDAKKKWKFKDLKKLIKRGEIQRFTSVILKRPELSCIRGDPFQTSLLHVASSHNRPNCIHFLVEQGCDVNSKDKFKENPIHAAVRAGHLDAVKALVSIDNSIVNSLNKDEWTPLHIAATNNKHEIIKFLLRQPNINTKIPNNKGLFPHQMVYVQEDTKRIFLDYHMGAYAN